MRFLSTPSARRATRITPRLPPRLSNFYPRPPRGGRPGLRCLRGRDHRISIHALREEGDLASRRLRVHDKVISIHALREEGDIGKKEDELLPVLFLSTPSARRATRRCLSLSNRLSNFYPRPPRGGRHESATVTFKAKEFLSTPSARRATRVSLSTVPGLRYFYPRPPRGGRPTVLALYVDELKISIHALREEGDYLSFAPVSWMSYFYPRPPRGGRRVAKVAKISR